MTYIIRIIKGFFVGIALIVPGLSGGTLAIYLGIYEKLLHAIGNIFNEFRNSLEFLIPLFIGIAISVIGLAKLLGYLIDVNSFIVLIFFIGLLLGGAKDIYNKATPDEKKPNLSSVFAFFVSFMIIILLTIFGKIDGAIGMDYIDINLLNIVILFFLGMAASMTMIVPGISGSALLIVLGYYTAIVTNVVGNILDIASLSYNLQIIIPFALGAAFGIIAFSKVIELALKTYTKQTYSAILGFILASVIAIFFEIKDPSTAASHEMQTPIYEDLLPFFGNHIVSLIAAIILFIIGFVIAKKLTILESKRIK